LRKTFSQGLQFQGSYTWSKCMSDETSGTPGAGPAGAGQLTNSGDPGNRAQMRGLCDFLRPQRFVVNYTYELPGYKGGNRFLSKSLSGWSVSGVTTAQNGPPLTITDTRGGAIYGFASFQGQTAGSSRGQMCPGKTSADVTTSGTVESRLGNYLNASAFCPVPIVGAINGVGGATGWGNTGRGISLGPGQFNSDISIAKKTVVGGLQENGLLEFRAEFFNAFNHPQFGLPNQNVASAAFGTITSTTVGPRVIQFALRYAF
jgi:hypothetical protein